jgi:RNA polymerase sigma factor (sigma-70 family)
MDKTLGFVACRGGVFMEAKKSQSQRRYLAAVVLGSALAALGPNGAASAHEISGQAIQDISRYCTACWRNARLPVDRWGDCTQDVLRRLLERLEPTAWDQVLTREGEERKEFIRAIDTVKKRTQRERRQGTLFEDRATAPENQALDEDRDALRQAAGRLLSPRQQEIVRMACEGWSIADTAKELSTTAERVSDDKYKAIQKLRAYFRE